MPTGSESVSDWELVDGWVFLGTPTLNYDLHEIKIDVALKYKGMWRISCIHCASGHVQYRYVYGCSQQWRVECEAKDLMLALGGFIEGGVWVIYASCDSRHTGDLSWEIRDPRLIDVLKISALI